MERRAFFKKIFAVIGVSLTVGTAYAYQSSKIEVTRSTFPLPNLQHNVRAVALSDIHAPGCKFSFDELVSLISHESPDIFILAGDIVDERGHEDLVVAFYAVDARLAKLAVLGNWEYYGKLDLKKLKKEYEKANISLLVNHDVVVSGLRVMGLDDLLFGSPDFQMLNEGLHNNEPRLVISHCPKIFDSIHSSTSSSLLILSGHTHGGQIAPFGLPLLTPPGSGSYVKGWYRKDNHSMYVMRGIGTTPGIPLRLGARPEILVLDLIPAQVKE
jgi:hypothetical protein